MKLIVAEKPSVAKYIADVLGVKNKTKGYIYNDEYYITWAIGHLVTLEDPHGQNPDWSEKEWNLDELPMLPEVFKYKVIDNVKDQFEIVKDLIHRPEVDELINAGDDGREGEYIQRLIYEKAGNTKPVMRLRFSSMDAGTIKKAFQNLVPSSVMDNIYESAKCRAWSDWKIGMNLSRLVCVANGLYGYSIGRVQTTAVAMIANRNNEIANFISKNYYQVQAIFEANDNYTGNLIDEDGIVNFADKKDADDIIIQVKGKEGIITSIEKEKKKVSRPELYCLSALQTDANKRFGYSPNETLTYAQSLYEVHKITTYPRTDSRYLTTGIASEIPDYIDAIDGQGYPVSKTPIKNGAVIDKRVVDDKKVSDHHAIIINNNFASYDLSLLSDAERNILDLIIERMLISFSPDYEYMQTSVITEVGEHSFLLTGTETICLGWKETAQVLGARIKQDDSQIFVGIAENKKVPCVDSNRLDKKTVPPKQYTEGTLITAMVNVASLIDDKNLKQSIRLAKGIGTGATRGEIIKNIQDKGFVELKSVKKNKYLFVTEKGKNLLKIAPDKLKDPVMSAEWENCFSQIAAGKMSADEFNKEIDDYITEVVNNYHKVSGLTDPDAIGKCPYCGGSYKKGKFGLYCANRCGFVLKKFGGVELTDKQIENLLNGSEVLVKGLVSKKTGKPFDCYIKPKKNVDKFVTTDSEFNGKTYHMLSFDMRFPQKKAK